MLLFWCPDRSKRSFYGTFSRHLLPKIFFVFTCEHSSLFMVFFISCMTIPLLIFKTFVFFPGSINRPTLREKWAYSEFFWSLFSLIWTKYGVSLCIQSECGKIRTRKIPNIDTFHAVQNPTMRIGDIVHNLAPMGFVCL